MKSPETKLSDEQNYNWSQGNFILNQQLFHLPDSVLAPNPNFITQRKAIDHFDNKKRETIAPIQQALWNNAHVKQTAQLQSILKNSTSSKEIIQKKENNTGLPNNLKSGIESLSGYSMDDVKVHYNSSKPKQLEAHAYAQGTDIHLASGQEKHLAHEAWHVVQQKQGRVKPSFQMKQSQINDDSGLEHEAYLMGNRAMPIHLGKNMVESPIHQVHRSELSGKVVQRVRTKQKNPQKKHPSEQGTEVLVNKAELDIIKIQRF